MTAALVCSILMVYTSIEAFTIPAAPTQSYDVLLDELIAAENSRKTAIKKAKEEAAKKKSDGMSKFLEAAGEVDESLVKLRIYFDAGKAAFDVNKGKLSIQEEGVAAKTQLLQDQNYVPNQMARLAASLTTLEARMNDLTPDECNSSKLREVVTALRQSEQVLVPITSKFRIECDKIKGAG
ncbi:unnamed protein product [Bemisia tabaci]|uniref:Uncharacterized protein n=1 Tax=Bemisia tabaci TaxID=7038 RepID=A0A9P0AQT9_BEMTA|nr:unnamed protein product [Bemisia tabaci]